MGKADSLLALRNRWGGASAAVSAAVVSLETGVPVEKILSKERDYVTVRARQLTWYLCHTVQQVHIKVLARAFECDRATIRHGLGQIENELDCDPLEQAVERLGRRVLPRDGRDVLPLTAAERGLIIKLVERV